MLWSGCPIYLASGKATVSEPLDSIIYYFVSVGLGCECHGVPAGGRPVSAAAAASAWRRLGGGRAGVCQQLTHAVVICSI